MPAYNGCLLRLAIELGNRLLPAFDTASGVPLSWVNLKKVRPAARTILFLPCMFLTRLPPPLIRFCFSTARRKQQTENRIGMVLPCGERTTLHIEQAFDM
jgi:hypothetical protein